MGMNSTLTIIHNGKCPICAAEIGAYRRQAEAQGLPLNFVDLTEADMTPFGLSADQAARRLHVVQDGRLYSGIDGFVRLWRALPKTRWIAGLVDRPVLRPLAALIYDRVLAPLLYAMHRRRMARAQR